MAQRPIELEDLLKIEVAGAAVISPDGLHVAFTVRRIDAEKNVYHTRIWMGDAETGACRPFTGDGHSDSAPIWSPDGKALLFQSDRDKPKAIIYTIPVDGGEARTLVELDEGGIRDVRFSPDGSRIAFLYRRTPDDYTEEAKKAREESGASPPPRVHVKLAYRLDGEGYHNLAHWQLWVADASTGAASALTDEAHDFESPAWSPDGEALLVVANRSDDDDLTQSYERFWTIPAEGGELTHLPAPDGPKGAPVYSPDGRWIAYLGHTEPEERWGVMNIRVLLIPATGAEEAKDLTGASDVSAGHLTLSDCQETGEAFPLVWSPDGQWLTFSMSEHGRTRLWRVSRDGGDLAPLTPEEQGLGSFSVSADGKRFGLTLGSAIELPEVWLGEETDGALALRRLTEIHHAFHEDVALQLPEEAWVNNGEGGAVQTWTLTPPDAKPGERYPCVLYIHGGPALQYGGRTAPFHELQFLAAQGYVVVFPNPRGSKGYGEAWTGAIKGDWGGADWTDTQAVADRAAARPDVDPDRMAIMGGSYGGYMTAWAIGHTNRFRCAIADRLVNSLPSMAGTSDIVWSHGNFYKGNAWDDPSDLWRASPLAYAGRIETPLLLIHSDGDLRCPIGQAEELFAALRHQRKPVEFVRYPTTTSHGLSRNGPPDLRLDRLRRNLEWLNRHLKPSPEG